jgi:cytochrome c-type biogenesis protein CcmF
MWESLPEFGTGVLFAILVAASYTFAVSLMSARGRPRLLQSARLGAYGTCALILLGVLILAYAFVTHDFRIRYVSRYSDRSMSLGYLITALWGGQDGSILWWLFLLSLYTGACVRWLSGRYRQLQPYVIATLMVIMGFFAVLMLFSANPFETNLSGAKLDGEGLNPLLRNYYMIIHPPSLYMGFVGCSIPFAFAVAALITGRLDNEWIIAVRKWMLFAWGFLTIGNALGMLWAYEELGWGGYWAWDPVENAACLPWFTATAYVHSTMIQERRGLFRVWNLMLIGITFFLTIFGTFLTRSGLIASVHSFAQSDIGTYFVYFMFLIIATMLGLLIWRWPLLRAPAKIESVASREAAFVVNNWALLGAAVFVTVATVFPVISEGLWNETVTVGPPFYNKWMAPIGLLILALMGVAPLFGWRKTSGVSLRRAATFPLLVMTVMVVVHFAIGSSLGLPPIISIEDAGGGGFTDTLLNLFDSVAPGLTVALVFFNIGVVAQEFQRGIAARRRNATEGVLAALVTLVARSRRRYGGYIVHLGVGLMFLGFAGKGWDLEREASLFPGESIEVGDYQLTYRAPRMEVDEEKRMVFADVDISVGGHFLGTRSPAQFIYMKAQMPTSEVSMLHRVKDDLYLVVGSVNPTTKRATFRFHVNPLVSWIWLGVVIMIGGAGISLWPEVSWRRLGVWGSLRLAAGATAGVMFSIMAASAPARASSTVPTRVLTQHWPTLQASAEQPAVRQRDADSVVSP